VLGVDPTEPKVVYVNAHPERLFVSTDSGQTWTRVAIDQDPVNVYFDSTGTMAFVTDQGINRVLRPRDPNQMSVISKQGNLGNFLFYNVTLDPRNPRRGFCISQDQIPMPHFTGEPRWISASAGNEVGKVLIDTRDPNFVYNLAPVNSGFVKRSTDGGNEWADASTGICTNDFLTALPEQTAYNAFALDEHRPSRLVLGGQRVWQTLDRGDHWTQISPVLSPTAGGRAAASDGGLLCLGTGATITAIAIAPSQPDTIYAATQDGRFFATSDGGSNWRPRHQGLPVGSLGEALDIAIDPTDPENVFIQMTTVAAHGPTDGRVWRTTNGGLSWSSIDAAIPPNLLVMSLAVDWSFQPPTLYVGTVRGLFFSTDLGANWAPFGQGLPRTVVRGLQILPKQRLLVASTLGRGIYQIPLPMPRAQR